MKKNLTVSLCRRCLIKDSLDSGGGGSEAGRGNMGIQEARIVAAVWDVWD